MNEADSPQSRDLEIFTDALRLPATDRAAYLNQACGHDRDLRQRVEELIQAHDQAGEFLEQPPLESPRSAGSDASSLEKPGDRIGRYKLLQQIGEGGCGVVYMAEQEEPIRRRVALKIIKAGMDTKSVIARFEAERQALAMMDHPNIAKVLDAGATESGRPYFVMELVRGVKISEYCDEHSLTTEERLNLFIQVCQAVQHAHQKGIIHRDLKPSNILVTTNVTGEASPVVIDFGIAKATTNQRLTDKTLFTAFDMLIGTPAYMSPEQAVLTSVDVDTRTDIYSLGVLLYELLTSVTPFDAGELMKAGLDEVRRVIREREPIRPSSRLSRMTKDDLTTIAHHRKAEPPKLIRAVHGDLDWIVMKALEKDRTRRYETANGLALDIKRYLTNETISARPPSTLYRFQKTVVRHKILFGGLAAVALLLVVSLVFITASLTKERQARKEADAALRQAEIDKAKANTETAKSQQVTRFLEDMLQGVGPSVAQGRDTKMLREILDKAAGRIDTKLSDQPATQTELQKRIGNVYTELAVFDRAEAMFRAALALDRRLSGNESEEVADSLNGLGRVLFLRGDLAGAEKAYGEALAVRRKLPASDPLGLAITLKGLSEVYFRLGRFPETETLVRESLAIRRKLTGNESVETADSLSGLAVLLGYEGKLAEEEVVAREVFALRLKQLGPDHPQTVTAQFNLAVTLAAEEKLAEAEASFREVLAQQRKLYGDAHVDVSRTLLTLGKLLNREDRLKEAGAIYEEALAIQRKTWSDDMNILNTESLRGLAMVLQKQGKLAEAEVAARQLLNVARKLLGERATPAALDRLVQVLIEEKKFDDADQILAEVIPPGLVPTAQNADLFFVRASYCGRRGKWSAALADVTVELEYHPTDQVSFKILAGALVALRDTAGYRQFGDRVLRKFGESTTTATIDQLVAASLVLPVAGLDLKAFEQMLARWNHAGLREDLVHRYEGAKALLEYRQGHFAQAAEWAAKSIQSPVIEIQTKSFAVLAMAQCQLTQIGAAKNAWAEGDERVKHKLAPVGSSEVGDYWEEWVFAHALMSEATAMIEAVPVAENVRGKP